MKSRNIYRHTEIKKYFRNNARVKRKFRKQIELNENKNKICVEEIIKKDNSHSVMSNSLQPHELYIAYQAPLSMEFSMDKNTGVCYCSLLLRIFPIQELNLGLLHCRWILYHLSHKEAPKYIRRG